MEGGEFFKAVSDIEDGVTRRSEQLSSRTGHEQDELFGRRPYARQAP